MGTFELQRTMVGDRDHVFSVVGDLPAYGRYLPMTRIEHDPGPIGEGWRFTGYSGLGPVALVDRMQVTAWDPPHRFAVRKHGPVLLGWAQATVEMAQGGEDRSHLAVSTDGKPAPPQCRVLWREHIVVRPARIGRVLAPATDRFNTWLFGRALDAMAAVSGSAAP